VKKIFSAVIALTVILSACLFAFPSAGAEGDSGLKYSEKYDPKSNTVTVTVSVTNAVGLSSGSVSVVYDSEMVTPADSKSLFTALTDSMIIEGGETMDKSAHECALAFMAYSAVTDADCNSDGSFDLGEFKFNITGDYKENTFYVYTDSLEVNGAEIKVSPIGNQSIAPAQDTTANREAVTMEPITGGIKDGASSSKNSASSKNIAIYICTGIAAAAVVAVIIVVVAKKKKAEPAPSDKTDGDKNKDSGDNK